jgi:hypothetical protein
MTASVARLVKVFESRPVVVRIDGRPTRIALLVGAPAPGFYCVRLSRGGRLGGWRSTPDRCYSRKVRRIVAGELLRDATAREIELGYIVSSGPMLSLEASRP